MLVGEEGEIVCVNFCTWFFIVSQKERENFWHNSKFKSFKIKYNRSERSKGAKSVEKAKNGKKGGKGQKLPRQNGYNGGEEENDLEGDKGKKAAIVVSEKF